MGWKRRREAAHLSVHPGDLSKLHQSLSWFTRSSCQALNPETSTVAAVRCTVIHRALNVKTIWSLRLTAARLTSTSTQLLTFVYRFFGCSSTCQKNDFRCTSDSMLNSWMGDTTWLRLGGCSWGKWPRRGSRDPLKHLQSEWKCEEFFRTKVTRTYFLKTLIFSGYSLSTVIYK